MKNLIDILKESLRIGINDEPEEDMNVLYRVELTKGSIYVDIYKVKGISIHKNSVYLKNAESLVNGGVIEGDYELVPYDGYMFRYLRNTNELRILLLPENKDKFYKLFDLIYSKGFYLNISIYDICELLDIDSITKMIQDWINDSLTINVTSYILDAINEYKNNDK